MASSPELSRRGFLAAATALGLAKFVPAIATTPEMNEQISGLVRRSDFALPRDMTYLNTGSIGPSPKAVLAKIVSSWHLIESSPVAECYYVDAIGRLDAVRKQIGNLLRCDKEDLVFTGSTTDGMNRLAFALNLQPGDHVISTDQEHEGGHGCWKFHARSRGVEIEDIPVPLEERDPQAILDRFERAIKPNTRAISFSHVLHTNGLRMPAAELCAMARRHGVISIVDGAQAVGSIDVDISKIGCDAYAAPGHKWLLGPKGTGFIFANRAAAPRLDFVTRLTDTNAQSENTGVSNFTGILGLGAALEYITKAGMAAIERHNLSLGQFAYDKIQELPVKLLSPRDGPLQSALLAFKIKDGLDIRKTIPLFVAKDRLVIRGLPAIQGLRISSHLFNAEADVERAVGVLKRRLA